VGGDIAHAKLDMSPELVDLISEFFSKLADIAPTVVIAGNHDCNLNNLHRLDVLQPIVKNLKHSNLHYMRNTCTFKVADVTFAVMSVFDEHNVEKYHKAIDLVGDTKIALFHGSIDNCSTDFGFHLKNPEHTTNLFKGYDLALLGDIHKRQFMDKEHTIAYCGSLIQQNHGESLEHGYLTWDIPTKKATFEKIENDYGYYTLEIDNGVVPMVDDMPKKARLRVRISNTDSSMIKKVTSKIHKTYGIKEISINRTDTLSQSKTGDRLNKINVGDVRNTDYQYTLMDDYLRRQYAIDDIVLAKIKVINEDLNSQLPEEEVSRNVHWKLKKFEFDNMFSFGDKNIIDFEKTNGSVGLFAANASGKSSLLDALSFCLFDTCSRTIYARDVMNNKQATFNCKLNFSVSDQDYFIERRAKKHKNGHVKVDVDFWITDDAGDRVSMNGDQRRTTNLNIRKIIGDYSDFIMTALSLQSQGNVFIEKTQKERKEILAQFMDINVFDQLYCLAQEEIHDVAAILRNLKKHDYGYELSEAEQKYELSKDDYDKFEVIRKELVKHQKIKNSEVLLLSKKLNNIDSAVVDIDSLEKQNQNLNEKSDNIDDDIDNIEVKTTDNKELFHTINNDLMKYTEVEKKYLEYQHLITDRDGIKLRLDNLKQEVRFKLDKVEKLNKHEYDPDCDYCVKNPFVKDAMKTKGELEDDKKTAQSMLLSFNQYEDKINTEYPTIEDDKQIYDKLLLDFDRVKSQQRNLNSEKVSLMSQRTSLETQIEATDDKILRYYENEDMIQANKEIEKQISKAQEKLDNLNIKLSQSDTEMKKLHGEVTIYKNKIDQINKTIQEIKDLEDNFEAYEYYMDAVKRDGVPYELITKVLPTIETEVNGILDQIVDFNMVLEMDGKNINTKIVYDEHNVWPLELSSGMERFISALAIRVALINLSNLPRPDFLAIDEGFGVLDSDNLNSLAMLFDYLKGQFKFLMIISHIDAMRDIMDVLVEIKKENGYSSVNYS
jgi:DNA repair exonuclease SbcCD ATPase subunit